MFPNVKKSDRHPLSEMKFLYFILILISYLFSLSSVAQAQIESAGQLVLVVAPEWNSKTGTMYLFDRTDEGWSQYNVPWKVILGDSGLAWGIGIHTNPANDRVKIEGDHRSPAGVFELGEFFGYDSTPPPRIRFPYRQATKAVHCVDDTGSLFYNSFIGENQVVRDSAGKLPWKSSEAMRLDSVDYKYGIVVRHNPRAIPGKGSCIFLHLMRADSSATTGCTAMGEDNMLFLMQWLDPEKHPLFVELPAATFREYLLNWNLPLLLKK
jgi:L,D-peptidoglycan transpeptidase YkuD (ErfK/YbiS/YcfS/YnhG family)